MDQNGAVIFMVGQDEFVNEPATLTEEMRAEPIDHHYDLRIMTLKLI